MTQRLTSDHNVSLRVVLLRTTRSDTLWSARRVTSNFDMSLLITTALTASIRFEWKWAELHAYNDNIDWSPPPKPSSFPAQSSASTHNLWYRLYRKVPHAPTRDPSLASENSHLRPYTLTLNPELICCERCVTVTLLWDLGVQFCVIRRRFHSCALRNRKLKGILSDHHRGITFA
eukprot:3520048-Rhodomonas_salina.1